MISLAPGKITKLGYRNSLYRVSTLAQAMACLERLHDEYLHCRLKNKMKTNR